MIFAFLSSCSSKPDVKAVQTAIAETIQANPTVTLTPTVTLLPTDTLIPTVSDTPTITNTHTRTPTSTPTLTPIPTMTLTPTETFTPPPPIEQTRTAYLSTQQARSQGMTATQDYLAMAAQATRQSRNSTATEIASYNAISRQELINYPNNHTGEWVIVRGLVFNVASNTQFQMYYYGSWDAIYVIMSESYEKIYKDNYVVVYGRVGGQQCFTNAYGAEICQPLINGDFFGK